MSISPAPHKQLCRMPSACLGNRPGDPREAAQTSLEEADSVVESEGFSLFHLFSLCLGKHGGKSSPAPAAAEAKQAFYE